jgi:DNA-binding SARP family transcriptional activator
MEIPDLSVDESHATENVIPLAMLRERATALDRQMQALAIHLASFDTELDHWQQLVDEQRRPLGDIRGDRLTKPAQSVVPWCTLSLLGPVVVTCGGTQVDLRRRGKAEAVLKALALSRDRRVASGLLAEWVWPGLDGQEARHSLQTTVSALRRCFQHLPEARDLIRFAGDAYHLDPDVVTDIELFDRSYERALALERSGSLNLAQQALFSALPHYRDDLEIDEFEDLRFLIERERLSAINLNILGKISAMLFQSGHWEESILYARQLLSRDPSREDAHRLIIRSYLNLGQRSQGMHQFELCVRVIRHSFDSDVEPETAALRTELLP